MKNRSVILISVLFSLMLIGIIMVQAEWIARIDILNRKAFNDAVYKSLGAVVKQVQEKENFVFVKHELETDTLLRRTKKMLNRKSVPKSRIEEVSNSVMISVNSEKGKETETVVRIEKNNNGHKSVSSRIIVGSSAEVPGAPPVPPVPPTAAAAEIPALAAENRKEDLEIIIEKMMGINNPDAVTIKPEEIEKIIATQLKQNNLPEKFSFALLSKDPKKSYLHPGAGGAFFKINLYPNDLFGRDVTLVLFLDPKDVITGFKENYLPQLLSLFFTLALLFLFIYSIRMLLRHKKMLAQKNDFINHMSHEFKTPLAGISLGADMLLDKPEKVTPEHINKVARIIKKQSERLDKEVTGVLLSAQLEEDLGNNRVAFDLVEIIKNQVDLFSLQLENKNAKVTTNFSESIIGMMGDRSLWQKVVSNLLDNSLKFSKEDPEINIVVTKAGGETKFEFSDNGIGIEAKDLPHIFEKFYRSNYYKQSNIQGFGLGLNFVKKVVDSHKGTIRAESELGKGTKIIIELNG
ncbi:MAG: sensor histidine kinase [Bacteroidia bacterium]